MKLTLKWLKQYIDFDWSPEQLAERHSGPDSTAGLRVERRKGNVLP
jgi:hypothetical protein